MIIAIDPSINKTGYAIFKNGEYYCSGLIGTSKGSDVYRLQYLFKEISRFISGIAVEKAVIEEPGSFSYARSSNKWTGKALNQGSLAKLNMAIGAIIAACAVKGIEAEMVRAAEWKGQTGKKVFQCMAKQITGKDSMNHDEADAVMLGDYYIRTRGMRNVQVYKTAH